MKLHLITFSRKINYYVLFSYNHNSVNEFDLRKKIELFSEVLLDKNFNDNDNNNNNNK
jgi:hypothetical protein